jgi:AbrB family looped-hinge helix DNA binding protein
MDDTITLKVAQRGIVTLPKKLRKNYHLKPGDSFTLLDLGGVFVLSPRHSEIDSIAERIARTLTEKGETLETMLRALRRERESHGTAK